MPIVCESMVEEAALDWFRGLGYYVESSPDMSPGPDSLYYPLRASHADAVLTSAVRGSLRRLNSDLPEEALDDALRRLTRPEGTTPEARNRSFHRMVVDGVNVEYRDADGAVRGAQARVIDFDEPDANTWSAINQFTVSENGNTRRPDIVVFVNGLPLAVIELKNPADENATVWSAFHQLQTYKAELPSLFACNAVLLVSDGLQARLGTLSAGREWFKPWRTIGGQELAPAFYTELQMAIEGVFEKRRVDGQEWNYLAFGRPKNRRAADPLVRSGSSPRGAAGVNDRVMLGAGDELATHRSVASASGATPPDGVGALEGWSRFLGLSPSGGV